MGLLGCKKRKLRIVKQLVDDGAIQKYNKQKESNTF